MLVVFRGGHNWNKRECLISENIETHVQFRDSLDNIIILRRFSLKSGSINECQASSFIVIYWLHLSCTPPVRVNLEVFPTRELFDKLVG
jgi:hypothetical protein